MSFIVQVLSSSTFLCLISGILVSKSPSLSSTKNRSVHGKRTLTSLIASWVCKSMRPISIVEDEGLLSVIQHCLHLNSGKHRPSKMEVIAQYSFNTSLGLFSNVNGSDILPSRWSISREIKRKANDVRQRLSTLLKDSATKGCLAISPDLWSDKFEQNSYLGLTAHFVDDCGELRSIDLCCEPYQEINKCAPSVQKVRSTLLVSHLFALFALFVCFYLGGNYFGSISVRYR
jgi:hypothetical protein